MQIIIHISKEDAEAFRKGIADRHEMSEQDTDLYTATIVALESDSNVDLFDKAQIEIQE